MKSLSLKFNSAALILTAVMIFITSINVTAQISTKPPVKKVEKKDTKTVKPIGDKNSTTRQPSNSTSGTVPEPIVYAAGVDNNKAVLWVNGIAQYLSSESLVGEASSVFVSGNDVYVSYTQNNPNRIPIIWKNGSKTSLSKVADKHYILKSIFVSDNNVYVLGTEQNTNGSNSKIVLWKNGVREYITDGVQSAYPTSFYVSGNIVYILGRVIAQDNNPEASKLWTLGNPIPFTYPESFFAYSIFASSGKVYVTGKELSAAAVWENNQAIILPNTSNSTANSIFVSGNDVNIAGNTLNMQTYNPMITVWKNSLSTYYTNGIYEALPTSIYVLGNDVYVSGHEGNANNKSVAKIWKNGVATSLSDGTNDARVNSVFVK